MIAPKTNVTSSRPHCFQCWLHNKFGGTITDQSGKYWRSDFGIHQDFNFMVSNLAESISGPHGRSWRRRHYSKYQYHTDMQKSINLNNKRGTLCKQVLDTTCKIKTYIVHLRQNSCTKSRRIPGSVPRSFFLSCKWLRCKRDFHISRFYSDQDTTGMSIVSLDRVNIT